MAANPRGARQAGRYQIGRDQRAGRVVARRAQWRLRAVNHPREEIRELGYFN